MTTVSARLSVENEELRDQLLQTKEELNVMVKDRDFFRSQLQLVKEEKGRIVSSATKRQDGMKGEMDKLRQEINVLKRENEKLLHQVKIRDDQLLRVGEDIRALQGRHVDGPANQPNTNNDSLTEERRIKKELIFLIEKLLKIVKKNESINRLFQSLHCLDILDHRLL